ncbi:MAG: hypothetical protein AAFQ14_17830 [Cyanobacteria bacterium J06621_12]
MARHLDLRLTMQTLLVVSNHQISLTPESSIIAAFNQVNISILEIVRILPWVQQHQPDLIILDLEWTQVIDLQLITALRLDWLTRHIPILILANSPVSRQTSASLDYDACLTKPYSHAALEQIICSLAPLAAPQ